MTNNYVIKLSYMPSAMVQNKVPNGGGVLSFN